ncbi:unnamed protein product [Symbiodinium sp. CCMP2592]|nr:unnamed protein product [Symbiodinium sp. CCMP2592]
MKRPIFTGPGSLKRQKKPEPADGASQSTRAPLSQEAMPSQDTEPETSAMHAEPKHECVTSSSGVSAASLVAFSPAPSSSKSSRPRFLFEIYGADCKPEEAEEVFHEEAEVKDEEAEEVKHEEAEEVFHEEAEELKHEEAGVEGEALEATVEDWHQLPPVIRPVEDTLENVIEGIKTGRLAALAKTMEDQIGFTDSAWKSLAPRNAVQAFLGRYTHARNPVYHFEYFTDDNINFLVELITPAFFGRRYGGYVPAEKHVAETYACLAFKNDIAVDRARKKLLPPLQKVRNHCMLSRGQKEELRNRGFNPDVVQNDIYMLVYSGFRPLGCNTAFWDGNVSEPPMIGKTPE